MSTTVNNNDASSSSTSASNNAESFDLRMNGGSNQQPFLKPMFSSNTNSRGQRTHDDSDTENEQSDDESSNNVDVPTEYQLSDTLLGQYKHMVNNQGLLVEEELLNFPSNFQLNVAPFGTPEGITVSSTFDETETEHVRKLAKSIRKNNESKQSLLKLNYHSKPNAKKSVDSSGNNTTGNSSNSKSISGSNGRSNNFNGSPSNVASGSNNTKSANGTNNRFQKNKK
ncbi:hypothetical protein ACTFIR_011811 [Dictyostelium discoideum]